MRLAVVFRNASDPLWFATTDKTHRLEDQDGEYKGTPGELVYEYIGKIDKLTISLDRPKLTPVDVRKLKQAAASAADAQ